MKLRAKDRPGLTVFVTVGSTRFDKLITKCLSSGTVDQMCKLGFSRLIMQVGKSDYDRRTVNYLDQKFDLTIEIYDFKNELSEDIARADLVVGHAGAGTCLEVLRARKRLLVVVNDSLMDNHQAELANQLSDENYLVKTSVGNLNEDLASICDCNFKQLREFPAEDQSKFEKVFNDTLKKALSRL